MRAATFALIAMLAATSAGAQETVETVRGRYTIDLDQQGRHSRLDNGNGIVSTYLYESADPALVTGVSVRVDDKLTLTVHEDPDGSFRTQGMPRLKVVRPPDDSMIEVRADNRVIARFDYAGQSISTIALPGYLTMRLTPSDAHHWMHQTLTDANGKLLSQAEVMSSAADAGIWKRIAFETVATAVGFDPNPLRFETTPDSYLMIGRDWKGRAALYIVNMGECSVGFTPDGIPRYYDLAIAVTGTSTALEQRLGAPSYVTLTADGRPGVYIEEPGNNAIYAAWAEKKKKGIVPAFARAVIDDVASP